MIGISEFYHPPQHSKRSNLPDNTGCPYRGGPGWREDEDDRVAKESDEIEEASHFRSLVKGVFDLSQDNNGSLARPPKDWVALVERGGECSFVDKVSYSTPKLSGLNQD